VVDELDAVVLATDGDVVVDAAGAVVVEVQKLDEHVDVEPRAVGHATKVIALSAEVGPQRDVVVRRELAVARHGARAEEGLFEHRAHAALVFERVHEQPDLSLEREEVKIRRKFALGDVDPASSIEQLLGQDVERRDREAAGHRVLDRLWRQADLDGSGRGLDVPTSARKHRDCVAHDTRRYHVARAFQVRSRGRLCTVTDEQGR
jgi:hypothetical protein